MTFTAEETAWIEKVSKNSAAYKDAFDNLEAKETALSKIRAEVSALSGELQAANQDLKIKNMPWLGGGMDAEVDTKHDIVALEKGDVDQTKAAKVQKLQVRLVEIQKEMEAAEGKGGKLFTTKDIERELWTPLVREEIIPSNGVQDKYSEEAQVWNGACEVYAKRLEDQDFSRARDVIDYAKSFNDLAGAATNDIFTCANFEVMSISAKDTDFWALNRGDDNAVPDVKARWKALENDKTEVLSVQQQQAAAQAGFALINGTLTVIDSRLERGKSWTIAETVMEEVEKVALSSIDAVFAGIKSKDVNTSQSKQLANLQHVIKTGVKTFGKANKLVFRFHDIHEAAPGAKLKAATAMVDALAETIASAFALADKKSGRVKGGFDHGNKSLWAMHGKRIESSIKAASNAAKIADAWLEYHKSGKSISKAQIAALVGVNAIESTVTFKFDQLGDPNIKNTGSEADAYAKVAAHKGAARQWVETELGRAYRLDGAADGASNLIAINADMLDQFSKEFDAADAQPTEESIAKKAADAAMKKKVEDLKGFQKALANDPVAAKKLIDDIGAGVEERIKETRDLINKASLTPDDLDDDGKAEAAMKAVKALTAEVAACNAKWAALDAVTKGGAAAVVAMLPGAGVVAAAQKLIADIIALGRQSKLIHDWRKNVSLTYGTNSVYGPAIQQQMANLKIQVSQKSIYVLIDMVGLGAEAARLVDITGAATGLAAGATMARALTDFGYKMQKKAQVEAGWKLYLKARDQKGDRKAARKAMRWNSTLGKCVLAYGIVERGDPIARQVARNCGLTPTVLANDSDVCQKVVDYFQTLFSDDPVVVRQSPLPRKWHPGSPELKMESWMRFKGAAVTIAVPPLAETSANTAAIDGILAQYQLDIGRDGDYTAARDGFDDIEDRIDFLKDLGDNLKKLIAQFKAYAPVCGPYDETKKAEAPWSEGSTHKDMVKIKESLIAQAEVQLAEVKFDLQDLGSKL